MMRYFNQITFIYFLWFLISIIYAFEVTGNNNVDIKWNGLPQMATFNNYEDMEKYIISSRKMDTIKNPTMDSYLTAYNLHHIEQDTKHNINKRSANPYDFIKFELADAKVPDDQTKELLKVNRVREQKQINLKRKEEDSTGPTIIFGNRTKIMNTTTTKLIKRSDQIADDTEDQEISESRRSINFYQPRLNTHIKSKKSIKSFPHEVQKAINLVLLQENKQNNLISSGVNNNNIGLRYAPTHKQFYGDKILTHNYDGNFQNNDKLKYIYSPSQIPYNNYNNDGARYIAPYINLPSSSGISNNNEKQIISQPSSSIIIGNGIAPAPLNAHLSEISDVHQHTLIQPQNIVKVEPSEINYVMQEVPPPSLSSSESSPPSSSSYPEQILAKPSISYNQYLSTPNILHNELLLHKSVFTPSSELQFNDVIINNKGYSQENNNDKNDDGNNEHNQYKQFSYESFGDYEKQIIKEHNLFNGVNEQHKLTGKENNYNKDENDDGYEKSSSSSSNNNGGGDDKKFNILSSLIGKSPTEQLNGLTYLLENELHNNKNEQPQQQYQQEINPIRPQDNRAPILFHPDNNVGAGIVGQGKNIIINKYGYKEVTDNNQQNDYKPITEAPEEIHSHHIIHITPSPLPAPVSTSFKQVQSIGLSPNYKNIDYEPNEYGMKLDDKGLQYASKYTFGYRVRDFHTGNDFGHKQNRDHDGVTRGEYHILLPDGRVQNVRYHADDTGFHADVSFESGH